MVAAPFQFHPSTDLESLQMRRQPPADRGQRESRREKVDRSCKMLEVGQCALRPFRLSEMANVGAHDELELGQCKRRRVVIEVAEVGADGDGVVGERKRGRKGRTRRDWTKWFRERTSAPAFSAGGTPARSARRAPQKVRRPGLKSGCEVRTRFSVR